MKNTRAIVMLVVAAVAGLAAVVFAARLLHPPGEGRIAVAQLDIQLGSRISPEMVHLVSWPAGSVPQGAFTDTKNLDGRVAKTGLQRGEPVLESKLAPIGSTGGLSAVVKAGMRAMTVRVNDVIGVAGFALPGNYVDIMVNTQEEGAKAGDKDRTISKIVLEKILVLAVAQESNPDQTKPKVVNAVTLEVSPTDAEKLDLARSVGTLSLVLRNQIDPNPVSSGGATKDTLLGNSAPTPPAATPSAPTPPRKIVKEKRRAATAPVAPRTTHCVEVVRGGNMRTECF